jgi:hypothetical protein
VLARIAPVSVHVPTAGTPVYAKTVAADAAAFAAENTHVLGAVVQLVAKFTMQLVVAAAPILSVKL